jgi:hypothetical protein
MQACGQAHSGAYHQFGTDNQQHQPGEQFDHIDQGNIG